MARKPQKLPGYFTAEEASALVAAAPGCEVWMVMRIMLRTGLRVSGRLSLWPAGLRLNQEPPSSTCGRTCWATSPSGGRECRAPFHFPDWVKWVSSFPRKWEPT